MRLRSLAIASCFVPVLCGLFEPIKAQEKLPQVKGVAVIAHSVSTRMQAREVRAALGWIEVSPKQADHVLVVCRSGLYNPLSSMYECYCELDDNTEQQLNIAGSNYHIYLFTIEDDLSVMQVFHDSFVADD